MNILQVGIIIFVLIEFLNIMTLYFRPDSKMGNGVGVFNAYHKAQDDDEMKRFVSYLVNWVAGTKLIFIMLGIVIVIFGDYKTQVYSVTAFIISILSFYWRLYPTIKKADIGSEVTPKGYYKTLNYMIIGFVVIFAVFITISMIVNFIH